MKVAVVTDYFPTSLNPWAGHSAYQTLRLLAKQCDLHVFCPDPHYPSFLTPTARRGKVIDPTWSPPDVSVTYIPYPLLPVVSRPLNGLAIAHFLTPHIRAFQPDLILSYVIYPDGYAAVRISRTLNVPVVLTAIGSDLNRIPNRLVERHVRSALRHAGFTITVSHDLCTTARRLGSSPTRSKAELNGCDTAVFHPRDRAEARQSLDLPPDQDFLLYVGRLDVRKGLVELIEAMAQLRATRPDVHCYLVSDGPDRPILEQAITRLNLAANVTFVPACLSAQIATWMAAANLVTLPSYMEGCPNVVIEAMSSGRPVVATRVGGIPELMDDEAGRLVPPKDSKALAEALDTVLTKTWDAEAISKRHGRSWQEVATNVMRVLEQTRADYTPHP